MTFTIQAFIENNAGYKNILKTSWLETPLGSMIAIANNDALYLLEFTDRYRLERQIKRLRQNTNSAIIPGRTQPIDDIEKELNQYFAKKLAVFETPIMPLGSPFQQSVWKALKKIPPGETRSYAELANSIGNPPACRAVANANGSNPLAIVIPCHRVTNTNGNLGGYAGGLTRKQWLIEHEKNYYKGK